jgi:hypothetical protein
MNDFKIVKDLSSFNRWTNTTRYKSLKIEKDGKYYLYKEPQEDTNRLLLQNEVRWREFFDTVDFPGVVCSKIVEVSNNFIVFEWVDAPHLADPEPKSLEFISKDIKRYAQLLVAMDKAADGYKPLTNDRKATGNKKIDLSKKYIENNYPKLLNENLLTLRDLGVANDLIEENKQYLEKRYQHGDFVPWHIFNKDNLWIIFDAEHANSQKYRFRDLIHSYCRLSTVGKRPDLAKKLLVEFLDHSSISAEEFDKKTKALVMIRSIGNLFDAHNDLKTTNYLQEARSLFNVAKKGLINNL